jgi:hypothetical protein
MFVGVFDGIGLGATGGVNAYDAVRFRLRNLAKAALHLDLYLLQLRVFGRDAAILDGHVNRLLAAQSRQPSIISTLMTSRAATRTTDVTAAAISSLSRIGVCCRVCRDSLVEVHLAELGLTVQGLEAAARANQYIPLDAANGSSKQDRPRTLELTQLPVAVVLALPPLSRCRISPFRSPTINRCVGVSGDFCGGFRSCSNWWIALTM